MRQVITFLHATLLISLISCFFSRCQRMRNEAETRHKKRTNPRTVMADYYKHLSKLIERFKALELSINQHILRN